MMKATSYEEVEASRARVCEANPLTETVIGHRRQRLARVTGPWGDFEIWLDQVAGPIDTVHVVRQSSKDRRKYREHFETATAYRATDPDVAAVRQFDIADLLNGVVPGTAAFRVEKRHFRGGGRSTAYIGTAVVVGRTLFLFVLNSAAEDNLEAHEDDQAGNAFTSAVQAAVRRLSYARWVDDITSRLFIYFPDKSRLCRDERHAINLVDTLAWAQAVLHIAEQVFPNLDDGSAKVVLGIFLSMSAQELESIVNRLWGSRFGILRAGQWLGQEAPPVTHQLAVETVSDGRQTWTEENKHQLVLRDDAVEMLTRLVDTILRSAGDRIELGPAGVNGDKKAIPDWKHCAKIAGTKLGVQSRDWRHINRGGLPVHELSGGGAKSLRSYLAERWVDGWRTGRTPWDAPIPKVIASTFKVQLTEHQEWVDRDDGTVVVRTWQEMPLPELACDHPDCNRDGHVAEDGTHLSHGFGIPDWKWDRLLELLERTSRRSGEHVPGRGNGADALRYPFASTFEYEEDGSQFKLMSGKSNKHGPTYLLYTRRAAPDPNRAWTKGEDEICLGTAVARTLNRALGQDLEQLLLSIEQELVPLTIAETNDGNQSLPDERVECAQTALDHALTKQEEAWQAVKRARRARLTAKSELHEALEDARADKDELADAEEQLAEADEMLAEAKTAAEAADRNVERRRTEVATAAATEAKVAQERSATVDLSQHMVVAKALQKADGATLRILNDVILQMLDESSRIEVLDDDHTQIVVRPTWRFVAADTMEVLTHQRTVRIERLPANPKTKTKNVRLDHRDEQTIPRLLLHEGLSRVEVGRRFGIGFEPGDGKEYGFQIIRKWLDRHSFDRKLHHALLDAAPVARRVLFLTLTGDQQALDEALAAEGVGQDYADLLVQRFTSRDLVTRGSWGATWVGSNHADDRVVINALLRRGGRATVGDLANYTGLTEEQVARTAHVVPKSQRHLASPKFGQPAAVLKDEWRGQTVAPLPQREVWLLACPHECDGWVTHPLWTPETDPPVDAEYQHAALCPTCRRTPWSDTVYPEDYLRAWSGFVGRTGGSDTRKTTVLTSTPATLRAA